MLWILILLPLCMAAPCYLAGKRSAKAGWLLTTASALAELAACFLPGLSSASASAEWVCSVGLRLEMNGLGRIYVTLIAFMWSMTLLFSGEYFAGHHRSRYDAFTLLTLGGVQGVFLAADLATALMFFEVMSFASYVWVAQEETPGALRAGDTYLAVAVIGGMSALMGIFLLQSTLGTTRLDALAAAAAGCGQTGKLWAAGICILLGFGAKAGMVPLHIWLPKAHPVAPAPASALLSGILTKSGLWGILVISSRIFAQNAAWAALILTLGTVTMVLGAAMALVSVDLKRTLACSSMSQIGFVLVGVGMLCLPGAERELAARGAVLHMVNHSLFKLVLFQCAGALFVRAGSLDLNELKGLGRKLPGLCICFLLAAAGIGGVPGLSGYISKTLLHESIVSAESLCAWPLRAAEWLFLLSGGMTVGYMTKLFVCLFIERGERKETKKLRPASAAAIWIPAVGIPVLGLLPRLTMDRVAELGVPFLGAEAEERVRYFSGENLKGAAISIAIGAAIYLLFIRRVCIRNGKYVCPVPAGLDLEDRVYRPLLMKWIPGVLGPLAALFGENRLSARAARFVLEKLLVPAAALAGQNRVTGPLARTVTSAAKRLGRGLDDSTDAGLLLLSASVLRESLPAPEEKAFGAFSYRVGAGIDRAAVRRGKERRDEHRYAHRFYQAVHTVRDTWARITGSVSFALLMLCAATVFVFVYLVFFR